MNIATWNVNSIKARKERLLAFLERSSPDVLCLQELKVVEQEFPRSEIEALGYHCAVHAQRTYNGVAILSKTPLEDVQAGMNDGVDDPQARFLEATTNGVRVICVYVPNGQSVGSDKYDYKLAWYDRLLRYLMSRCDRTEQIVLCGDFNVAPNDGDVAKQEEWANSVLCHPDARNAWQRLLRWGLVDTFAEKHPEGKVYSWWDYRNLGFVKNNGMRIDHLLCTPSASERCEKAWADRDERKGKSPSDHVPVVLELS